MKHLFILYIPKYEDKGSELAQFSQPLTLRVCNWVQKVVLSLPELPYRLMTKYS
jgi:hypothetical protein